MSDAEILQTTCPYCWQVIDVHLGLVDEAVEFIEDCEVCCRPMVVRVDVDEHAEPVATAERENE